MQLAAEAAPAVGEEQLTAQEWFERGFDATDPDEIIRCYSEAIRLKPDHAEAYYNRGIARHAEGTLAGAEAAIADFQKYLDLGGGLRDGDQAKVEGFIRELKKKL